MQTKLYTPDAAEPGNCFAAAVASVLEVPLWMVPPIEQFYGMRQCHWSERLDESLSL